MNFEGLLEAAHNAVRSLNRPWDDRLNVILRYCVDHGAFPKIGRLRPEGEALPAYLKLYIERYYRAREQRLEFRAVGTIPDPAVDVILQAFIGTSDLSVVSEHHRQSMAAENLLGLLLERYIAEQLEPQGWVWCAGNTVRSVDFLSGDLSTALQVKNRDNSENSSSSAIRQGTSIKKWHRINSKTGKTNWLNFPVKEVSLSEEGFHRYIEAYANSLK